MERTAPAGHPQSRRLILSISSHLILSHLISFHLMSSHFLSSHLTSSHFTSSHLVLSDQCVHDIARSEHRVLAILEEIVQITDPRMRAVLDHTHSFNWNSGRSKDVHVTPESKITFAWNDRLGVVVTISAIRLNFRATRSAK